MTDQITVDEFVEYQRTGRWPASLSKKKPPAEVVESAPVSRFATMAKGSKPRGVMNSTEAKWAEQLEALRLAGELAEWWYEPLRLRLTDPAPGGRALYYGPDFLWIASDGSATVDEVKARALNDPAAIVRLKTAASKFRAWARFRLVVRSGSTWEITDL